MEKVKPPKLKCFRCGHEWIPKEKIVTMCPKCKTEDWDTPKLGIRR